MSAYIWRLWYLSSAMSEKLGLSDLMKESETALWDASHAKTGRRARAAMWVTSDFNLLELWRMRHTHLMQPVATTAHRFGQPARLRAAGVLLIERCAFVDYLRERQVSRSARDRMIARLRGTEKPHRALLDEHRDYILAVSSALCVDHLLHRVADPMGLRLLQRYQALYVEHFGFVCDSLLGANGRPFDTREQAALPPEVVRLKSVLTTHPA